MKHVLAFCAVLLLAGCAVGRDGLTTGVDGCTSLSIDEGQINVPTLFNANGKNLRWHKINDKCKDVPYHGMPQPVETP